MGYEPSFLEIFYFAILPALSMGSAVFTGTYLGISLALRRRSSQKASDYGASSPLNIVRERYARGDISRGEYERMRDDLTGPTDTKIREA